MAGCGAPGMSRLRHVVSRSLGVALFDGYEPEGFTLEAYPGQQALAGFVAETCVEVAAFGTTGRRTQGISLIAADHAKEELLPFHVLSVAAGQRGKVPLHQAAQLATVRESQILP